MTHKIDVVITQIDKTATSNESEGLATYSWNDYAFGQHSNWVNVFKAGVGNMDIYENVNGHRSANPVFSKRIPLTPVRVSRLFVYLLYILASFGRAL